jgi:cytochrome P450
MRLYPPAWVITRRALEDDVIGDHRVRKGTLVVLSPYVTHRHPEFWTAPDRFDPERFLAVSPSERPRYAYFPFGGGPHLCIGNHFAMVEAVLIIAAAARRYQFTGTGGAPDVVAGVTLHPRDGLRMRVDLKR